MAVGTFRQEQFLIVHLTVRQAAILVKYTGSKLSLAICADKVLNVPYCVEGQQDLHSTARALYSNSLGDNTLLEYLLQSFSVICTNIYEGRDGLKFGGQTFGSALAGSILVCGKTSVTFSIVFSATVLNYLTIICPLA